MRCGDSRSAEKAALERREVAGGTCSAARAPSMRRAPSGVLLVSAAVRPQRQSAPTANRRFRFCSNSSSPAGSSNCRRAARDRAPGCENPRRRALGAGLRAPGRGALAAGRRAAGYGALGVGRRVPGAERLWPGFGLWGAGPRGCGRLGQSAGRGALDPGVSGARRWAAGCRPSLFARPKCRKNFLRWSKFG